MAVCDSLPIPRVDVLLGNDLVGGQVVVNPVVTTVTTGADPVMADELQICHHESVMTDASPCCATTRSASRRSETHEVSLDDTFQFLCFLIRGVMGLTVKMKGWKRRVKILPRNRGKTA